MADNTQIRAMTPEESKNAKRDEVKSKAGDFIRKAGKEALRMATMGIAPAAAQAGKLAGRATQKRKVARKAQRGTGR